MNQYEEAHKLVLKHVASLPQLVELIGELDEEIYYIRSDWPDLGWDTDGCPDGDLCDQFERRLVEAEQLIHKIRELLPQ
jgi:hypothetical protein